MIKTDTVLTLRDLRGEHAPEVRRLPSGGRWADREHFHIQALIELAGVALEWRKDDRYPAPEGVFEGAEPERDTSVLDFIKQIAKALADGDRISFYSYGADCSLIMSWEPAA